MSTIRAPTRTASISGPLSPSNTVLGKRRALADAEGDDEQPDVKRTKGCAVLAGEWDASANKENIPPFARAAGPRRPTTLSRRASTGPGLAGVGSGSAPIRLRRSFSYAAPATATSTKATSLGAWASGVDDASSPPLSSSP